MMRISTQEILPTQAGSKFPMVLPETIRAGLLAIAPTRSQLTAVHQILSAQSHK